MDVLMNGGVSLCANDKLNGFRIVLFSKTKSLNLNIQMGYKCLRKDSFLEIKLLQFKSLLLKNFMYYTMHTSKAFKCHNKTIFKWNLKFGEC